MASINIAGDTSGVVTLQAPSVAGSTTLNLPATSGTVMVNGPAFSAYQSSTDSVGNVTWTKISFQTENFDTNSNFSSSRFTPTIAGYYQINASMMFNTNSVVTRIAIYKNGVSYCQSGMPPQSGALAASGTVSSVVYLNGTTDYVEIYGLQTSGGTITTLAGLDLTQFSGSMVRSA